MSEKPLERLNYFNGQRLQAGDFKLEQEYHLRVRRWLNRSLYTPGIAMGLEVYPIAGSPQVRVHPGLAIDPLGREIILLEKRDVPVQFDLGSPCRSNGTYLVIRYDESVLALEDACCVPGEARDNKAAQGGPSRILSDPVLEFVPDLPHEASGKIVLGRVELDSTCSSVRHIDTSIRRYVSDGPTARVRQYALEGVRDIDPKNPGTVRFHIRGRQPTSVTLYLRAELFPSLYYTELGAHTHTVSVGVDSITVPAHSHPILPVAGALGTGLGGDHNHPVNDIRALSRNVLVDADHALLIEFRLPDPPPPIPAIHKDQSLAHWTKMSIDLQSHEGHSHPIPARTEQHPDVPIAITGHGGSADAGITNVRARTGPGQVALTYVKDMEVWIGSGQQPLRNKTPEILAMLRSSQPNASWTSLGDGVTQPVHTLVSSGTPAIKLDYLSGLAFDEGEHVIEFRVTEGGGRIHYNLYVE